MDLNINTLTGVPSMNYFNNNLANPIVITFIIFVVLLYILLFSSLGNNTTETVTSTQSRANLEILLWSIFLIIIVINSMNYFLNINVVTSLKNIFTAEPELDIRVEKESEGDITGSDDVPELRFEKQVYNIPGNKYNYEDAKAICRAYGNRLANYKELQDAYEKGADWCTYGWSEDQMALFPTQMEKWEHLQDIKGHKNDCGRPGINGGYIENPNVKFGVNCYGYRPKITSQEAELMKNIPLYTKTQKELNFNKRIAYWKNKIGEIIVSPFNSNNWSMNP